MPSLETHLKNSEKRLGKPHPVHHWLDGPDVPYFTRLKRHNPCALRKNIRVVRALYGEEGVREYIEHMKEDWPGWVWKTLRIETLSITSESSGH